MVMGINANQDTFLLFFHGLDSSNETSKYTCIVREPKYCETVDYRNNFKGVFDIYDGLIKKYRTEYKHLVLAGHSLGGWFANHFAHEYNLPALLIAPCINPSELLADRIPEIGDMALPFLTKNTQDVRVMVEVEDERLPVAVARKTLVNLPESWQVDYLEHGHHRICRDDDIWYHICDLCHDGWAWIDDATWHGED